MKVLAFSSSRADNSDFLQPAKPVIETFLGDKQLTIAFVPFASVQKDYKEYTQMVRDALAHLPYKIETVFAENAVAVIENADAILVGGGNTFKLLHDIYQTKIFTLIKEKVNGGTPYIGWSAGSNITGLSISTTNDMPIIEPESFNALAFFNFQLNPHYYNVPIAGFNGETRNQRLTEFLLMNPGIPILGLPEGTAVMLDNQNCSIIGELPATLFTAVDKNGMPITEQIKPGEFSVTSLALH